MMSHENVVQSRAAIASRGCLRVASPLVRLRAARSTRSDHRGQAQRDLAYPEGLRARSLDQVEEEREPPYTGLELRPHVAEGWQARDVVREQFVVPQGRAFRKRGRARAR